MADVLISNLPSYTASTVSGTYFIINDSGNTTTFKATREQFVPVGFGTGTCSLVGGGSNTASGNCSASLAGSGNIACGPYSNVVGGQNNTACYFCSFIGGGASNGACGNGAFVGGGDNNKACGSYAVIVGGQRNTVSSSYATIVAGRSGTASGNRAFIGNGFYNTASGNYSTVVNGDSNTASGCHSFIGGGFLNTASGCHSFIGGGQYNYSSSCNQVITGGRNNCLSSYNQYSTIGGGFCNSPSGGFSPGVGATIAGGIGNGTSGGTFDSFSTFSWTLSPTSCYIGTFGFIGGGFQNNVFGGVSVAVGGCNNINCGCASFIGGGWNNLLNGYCSVLVGGLCNSILCTGFGNVINGGYCNKIVNGGSHYIGSGQYNTIGCCNFNACYNNVVGGTKAYSDGQFGFIGNSADCGVFSPCSNTIACATYGSTILNGAANTVCGSFSMGCYNFYSTILGGCCNTASCCFNLLYGCGNYAAGNYTNIIGCGLTGGSPCTTYFNNVCVCGTLSKLSGSFKIPHPDPSKTNKFLQHSFVEAPTAGENIYRHTITTTNCSSSLELPDYYRFLNGNDQVFVTPKNHFGSAYGIINQEQTCVSFCSNCDGEYNVLIIGTRKDKEAQKYWKGTEVNETQE